MLSSADPAKLSATVKGSVWFAVLTALTSVFHVNGLSDVADHGISFVVGAGQFVTAAYALYGALRKVKRTVGGTNLVLKDPTI